MKTRSPIKLHTDLLGFDCLFAVLFAFWVEKGLIEWLVPEASQALVVTIAGPAIGLTTLLFHLGAHRVLIKIYEHDDQDGA